MYCLRFTLAGRDQGTVLGVPSPALFEHPASSLQLPKKGPHQQALAAFPATCQSDHAVEVIRPLDEDRNNCSLTTESQQDEK